MKKPILYGLMAASLISIKPVVAEANPYWVITTWHAGTVCAARYGVLPIEEGTRIMLKLAKRDFDMEPWQVLNILRMKGIEKDMEKVVKDIGGCKKMADDLKNLHH